MQKFSIWVLYAVAAAAVVLGVAMLLGTISGRTGEALLIIGIGVASAAWTRMSVQRQGGQPQ